MTANLAASWALTGSRVIVVSADFRRPRLEEAFGLDVADRPGLSDLIKANWKQAEPSTDDPTASTSGGTGLRTGRPTAGTRPTPARPGGGRGRSSARPR